MTDDYTPLREFDIRHFWATHGPGDYVQRAACFDRWLAEVRRDEREKVAAEIERLYIPIAASATQAARNGAIVDAAWIARGDARTSPEVR